MRVLLVMQVASPRIQSFPATVNASLDAVVPAYFGEDTHNAVLPTASSPAQPLGRDDAAEARPAKRLARLPQRKTAGHVV